MKEQRNQTKPSQPNNHKEKGSQKPNYCLNFDNLLMSPSTVIYGCSLQISLFSLAEVRILQKHTPKLGERKEEAQDFSDGIF